MMATINLGYLVGKKEELLAIPSRKLSLHSSQAERLAELTSVEVTAARARDPVSIEGEQRFLESLPCVIYECGPSMELNFVSENILKLIGFEASELVGNRSLWEKRIVDQDLALVQRKLDELKTLKSVSMIHRLLDRRGLPVWVSHGLQQVTSGKGELFRGCLLGIGDDMRAQRLEHGAVERFVHKIGNHFQLLNLVVSSLRRVLPKSREADVLHETVERTIELTRSFSEYNYVPGSWLAAVDMFEVLQAAVRRHKPAFLAKGTILKERIDPSIDGQVSVSGDPFLLELAIGHVLQNALEAKGDGREVTLHARAESEAGVVSVVKISVIDSGCGIEEKELGQIFSPFFTTKEGHDGLGLSMACRFVEMHSGLIRVKSVEGEGTEVEIALPAVAVKRTPLE